MRWRAAFSLAENDSAPLATEPLARGFVDIDRACGILEAASVTAYPNDASESGGRKSPRTSDPRITVLRRLKLSIKKNNREVSL
jgi:hypothetical protein